MTYLVDLTLFLHHQTERAILVSTDGDEKKAEWVPLAVCEVTPVKGQTIEVTMPEHIAKEKGLI